jgi:hypothetical protein
MTPLPQESLGSGSKSQQSVFERSEERGLRAGWEDCSHFHFEMQILPSEPGYRESHYANLELFCPNRDGTFTAPIRDIPSGHGEQNEGNGEEGTCH